MENTQNCEKACSNKNPCTCASTDCERHGRCCDCVAYHRAQGSPPNCIGRPG